MVAVTPRKIPELGEWVRVDDIRAVVCGHFPDNAPWDFEVVYLEGEQAMTEPVVWRQGGWSFYYESPYGCFADHYPVVAEYVRQLRAG